MKIRKDKVSSENEKKNSSLFTENEDNWGWQGERVWKTATKMKGWCKDRDRIISLPHYPTINTVTKEIVQPCPFIHHNAFSNYLLFCTFPKDVQIFGASDMYRNCIYSSLVSTFMSLSTALPSVRLPNNHCAGDWKHSENSVQLIVTVKIPVMASHCFPPVAPIVEMKRSVGFCFHVNISCTFHKIIQHIFTV